jgi:hypothetical protein
MNTVAMMAAKIDVFMLKSTFRTFIRHETMGGFWSAT